MFRQVVIFQRNTGAWTSWVGTLAVLGTTLALLGLLILFFPRILIAMVSTIFILLGLMLLTVAWREWHIRKLKYAHLRRK